MDPTTYHASTLSANTINVEIYRNISTVVLEIGDPMDTPLSVSYILFWKVKEFCNTTSLIRVIIFCVIRVSLFFDCVVFVIASVSSMGILTKRSFMSYVISLWFSLIFRYVRSVARFLELVALLIVVKCKVFVC